MRTVFCSMRHLPVLAAASSSVARSAESLPIFAARAWTSGSPGPPPAGGAPRRSAPPLPCRRPPACREPSAAGLRGSCSPSFSLRSSTWTRTRAARSCCAHPGGVLVVLLGHRDHDRLHRRQPQRERARVVLDQHAEEALDAAEQRAVHHDRLVRLAVLADVLELEAVRVVEVHLDGRALPGAVQRVLDLDVDLRPVEDALARIHLVRRCRATSSARLQRRRRDLPLLVACPPRSPASSRGTMSYSVEAERRQHGGDEVQHAHDLGVELVRAAEEVRVVLGEAAHAHQAVQHARALEAVDGAELREAQRQLAVAAQLASCRS